MEYKTPQMSLTNFNLTSSNTITHPLSLPNATMRLRLYDAKGFPFVNAADAPGDAPIDVAGGVPMATFANQMHDWLRSISPS